MARRLGAHIAAFVLFAFTAPGAGAAESFDRVKAAYAALESYADRGTIVTEYRAAGAPATVERHRFVTRFQAPRNFYLEFDEDPKAGAEKLVVWSDGGPFNTWWSATRTVESHGQGRGSLAFLNTALPTKGASLRIPPLLLPQGQLPGPLSTVTDPRFVGRERDGDRELLVFEGHERTIGQRTERWPVRIWVDARSLLVVKVVEDLAPAGGGIVSTATTIFDPVANPPLAGVAWQYSPPR
jgi:hypothetical protein